MRDNLQRCRDILVAIQKIESRTAGVPQSQADELLLVWVIHHLQIIGEAASKISPEFRSEHTGIPWHKIIGTRHILVHGYFQIDTSLVWNTVTNDLPSLKTQVETLLDT